MAISSMQVEIYSHSLQYILIFSIFRMPLVTVNLAQITKVEESKLNNEQG